MLTPLVSFVEKRMHDVHNSASFIAFASGASWTAAHIPALGLQPSLAAKCTAAAVALISANRGLMAEHKAKSKKVFSALLLGICSLASSNGEWQAAAKMGTLAALSFVLGTKIIKPKVKGDYPPPSQYPTGIASLQSLYTRFYNVGLAALVTHTLNEYIVPLSLKSSHAVSMTLLTTSIYYLAQPFYTKVYARTKESNLAYLAKQMVTSAFLAWQVASRFGIDCYSKKTALPVVIATLALFANVFFAKEKQPYFIPKCTLATALDSVTSRYTHLIALPTLATYALNRWALPSHLQSAKAPYLTLLAAAVYYGSTLICQEADNLYKENKWKNYLGNLMNRVMTCSALTFLGSKKLQLLSPQWETNGLALGTALLPIVCSYAREKLISKQGVEDDYDVR